MKNLILFAVLLLFCVSCKKDDFNLDNPDVKQFVQQLKNGTYNQFEFAENGEKVWAIMPNFTKEHITLLINFATDTSLVSPCDHFPTNPISSIPPYRINNNKECIMLGEYLLWCVDGIIAERDFASMTPVLINQSYGDPKSLWGKEILEVQKIYQDWWTENNQSETTNKHPLEETNYRWR